MVELGAEVREKLAEVTALSAAIPDSLGDNIELWMTYLSQPQPWLREPTIDLNRSLAGTYPPVHRNGCSTGGLFIATLAFGYATLARVLGLAYLGQKVDLIDRSICRCQGGRPTTPGTDTEVRVGFGRGVKS